LSKEAITGAPRVAMTIRAMLFRLCVLLTAAIILGAVAILRQDLVHPSGTPRPASGGLPCRGLALADVENARQLVREQATKVGAPWPALASPEFWRMDVDSMIRELELADPDFRRLSSEAQRVVVERFKRDPATRALQCEDYLTWDAERVSALRTMPGALGAGWVISLLLVPLWLSYFAIRWVILSPLMRSR
jgi:hypothetical protein